MIRRFAVAALAAAILSASALASITLTATPDGTITGGETISIGVTGAGAEDFVFLALGPELGDTSVQLGPFATIDLGLATPFVLLPLGVGDTSIDVGIGEVPAELAGTTLHLQAFSAGFSVGSGGPTVETCVSNLDALTF